MTGALSLGLEVLLYIFALVLLGVAIYSVFLNPEAKQRFGEREQARARRFERREMERVDRRQNEAPPPGGVDRRRGGRRESDEV